MRIWIQISWLKADILSHDATFKSRLGLLGPKSSCQHIGGQGDSQGSCPCSIDSHTHQCPPSHPEPRTLWCPTLRGYDWSQSNLLCSRVAHKRKGQWAPSWLTQRAFIHRDTEQRSPVCTCYAVPFLRRCDDRWGNIPAVFWALPKCSMNITMELLTLVMITVMMGPHPGP